MSFNLSDSSLAKVLYLLKDLAPTEAFRFARTNKYIHYVTLNSTEGKWIPCEKDLILERGWRKSKGYIGAGIKLWNHRRRDGYSLKNCAYYQKMSITNEDKEVTEKLRGLIEQVAPKDKSFFFVNICNFLIDSEFVNLMMEWSNVMALHFHYCLFQISCQELAKLIRHLKPHTFFAMDGYHPIKFDNLFLSLFEGSFCLQMSYVAGVYVCPDIGDQALTNWLYKLPHRISLRSLLTNITLNGIITFVKDVIVRKKREIVNEIDTDSESEDDTNKTMEYDFGYIKTDEREIGIARNEFTEAQWICKRDNWSRIPTRLYSITVAEFGLKICFRTFTKKYHKITKHQALLKLEEFERKRDIREAEREASMADYRPFRPRGDLGGFDSDFEDEPREIVQREDEVDSCNGSNDNIFLDDSDREDILHILGETYQDWYDVKRKVSEVARYDKEEEKYFFEIDPDYDPVSEDEDVDEN